MKIIIFFLDFLVGAMAMGVPIKAGNCTAVLEPTSCQEYGEVGGVHWALLKGPGGSEVQAKLSGPVCTGSSDPLLARDMRFLASVDGKFKTISDVKAEYCSKVTNNHFTECSEPAEAWVCHLKPLANCKIEFKTDKHRMHISGHADGPVQYYITVNEEVESEGSCISCNGFSKSLDLQAGLTTFYVSCNKDFQEKSVALSKSEICLAKASSFKFGFDYKVCMNQFWYKSMSLLLALMIVTWCVPFTHIPINFVLSKLVKCCTRNPEKKPKVGKHFIPRSIFIIFFIILVNQVVWAEAGLLESLNDQGYRAEQVEFKGLYRTTIPESDFEIVSSGTGDTLKIDSFSVKLEPGFGLGMMIGDVEVDIKVKGTTAYFRNKDCYKTSETYIEQQSSDTCTADCNECKRKLKYNETVRSENVVSIPRTSSWSCDGAGCASIGTGCTCGWCELVPTGPLWKVCDLDLDRVEIQLCFNVGGKGLCKWLENSETFADGLYQVNIKVDKLVAPERLAEVNGMYYKGEMNKLDDLDSQFGDYQIRDSGFFYEAEVDYRHECHFLEHRRITFTMCGKNHFWKRHDLTECHSCKGVKEQVMIVDRPFGEATLKLNLPLTGLKLKEDVASVENLKISACKGCYNCLEGFNCKLNFKTVNVGLLDFKCNTAQARRKLLVKKGANVITVTFFTELKEGTLECHMGGKTGKVNYKLKKGELINGPLRSVLDKSVEDEYHCVYFSCTMGRWLYNMFGLKGLFHWLWIIALTILVLVILVLASKFIYNLASTRSKNGMRMVGNPMNQAKGRPYYDSVLGKYVNV